MSNPSDPNLLFPPPPSKGRIDVHSHLLPGIDDGCRDVGESIDCVRRLMAIGYVGTICTPHVWIDEFPENVAPNIRLWTTRLQAQLDKAGLKYRLWPGGEIRLFEGIERWVDNHEAPTLAGSKCLLVDFWAQAWPDWIVPAFSALIQRGYQPILAHPERLHWRQGLHESLGALSDMGVWLQGNFNSLTGQEGFLADHMARQLLLEDRYQLMGLDMHRPETLDTRFDGIRQMADGFGAKIVDQMTVDAPRRLIFGARV